MQEGYQSVDDIAAHFGVTTITVYNWIRSKRIPARKEGHQWLLKLEEIEGVIKKKKVLKELVPLPSPPITEKKRQKDKKFKFSGHQTFAFRYGWLEKGVRGLLDQPNLFAREDALVLLGVGKNMVESIRHWCGVTQLIEETEWRNTGAPGLKVTSIGEKLLRPRGWDPYLEDDASLWLIHWLLVSNPSVGTTWQIAFSLFQRGDFTKRELQDYVAAFAEKHGSEVNENSLSRDIDCFIRTYTPPARSTAKQALVEESFDCPLQELNLIQASPDGELYRFAVGPKPSLPTAIFGFALEQYFLAARVSGKTMGVQDCLYTPGSPGQAFKLDENSLISYIEDLHKLTGGKVSLDETAGLKQIYRHHEFEAAKLLADYYKAEARQ